MKTRGLKNRGLTERTQDSYHATTLKPGRAKSAKVFGSGLPCGWWVAKSHATSRIAASHYGTYAKLAEIVQELQRDTLQLLKEFRSKV